MEITHEEGPADVGFKNRSGLEILASIILAAVGGERKTHIMYKANLSHYQLQRCLTFLELRGLVKVIESRSGNASIYESTERGEEFLREYESMEKYLKMRTEKYPEWETPRVQ